MLNPPPQNFNNAAQGLAKVMLAVWFLPSIGANAPQVTLTLSFGGEGAVSDGRGSNISSIYGSMPHAPVGTVSLSDVSTSFGIQSSTVETPFCMLLIFFQTAQHITVPFHRSMQPVCLPSHFSYSLTCNLLQDVQNITCSEEHATCGPKRKTLPCHILCNLCVSRPIFSFPRNS